MIGSINRTLSYFFVLNSILLLSSCSLNKLIQCTQSFCTAQLNVTSNKSIITVGSQLQLKIEGGESPYSLRIVEGGGQISASGLFTAPNSEGSSIIEVKDARSQKFQITIIVKPNLSLFKTQVVSAQGVDSTWNISTYFSGGIPPYTYNIRNGPGQIDKDGNYRVPFSWSPTEVSIIDSDGSEVTLVIENRPTIVNGKVNKIIELNDSIYLAGLFNEVNPKSISSLAIIDSKTGAIINSACNWTTQIRGAINAALKDGDYMYLGGSISRFNEEVVNSLIKVRISDCSLVTVFTEEGGFSGPINTLAHDQNFIYVGFSGSKNYRGNVIQGIAKVRKDNGNLDTVFTQSIGIANEWGNAGDVSSMVQFDGSLYVVGTFETYRGINSKNLAKIYVNSGDLDTTFTQVNGLNSSANSIIYANNSIYVSGQFGTYRGNFNGARLVKLDPVTGDMDITFNSAVGFSSTVFKIVAGNNSIYALGQFSIYRGQPAERLAKIDWNNGNLDTTFTQPTGFTGLHSAMEYSNGFLFVGGGISTYRGQKVKDILKVDATSGEVDNAFTKNIGFNSGVGNILANMDQLIISGSFQTYRGVYANGILKVNKSTGELDQNFINNANVGSIKDISTDGTNIYLAGGTKGVTKINAVTGEIDSDFPSGSGVSLTVEKLVVVNSSLYLAGRFTSFNGSPAQRLAKIDLINGDLDTTFTQASGFNHWVEDITADETHLYVAGYFTQYRGTTVQRLAKLDLNSGNLDTTFATPSGFNLDVNTIYLDTNEIIAAGGFSTYRGINVGGIAKLSKINGNMETTFSQSPGINAGNSVRKIIKSGSSYYIVGEFSSYRGVNRPGMIKIDEVNGDLDSDFSNSNGFSNVHANEIFDLGSQLYVAGNFNYYLNKSANYLVRVAKDTGVPE